MLGRANELNEKYCKVLRVAESRRNLTRYIATLRDTYPLISFDGVSEAHQCDLVWAYQDLEAYRVGEVDVNSEEAPSFHKVLYWLERAIRGGKDERLTGRWSQKDIDSFWQQLVCTQIKAVSRPC